MTRPGVTRKKTAAVLLSVILATSGIYVLWLYSTDQPPFCHGYPPGGNCTANYAYSFLVSVNYSSSWSLTYYGFHSGAPPSPFSGAGSYTGGSYTGTGPSERVIMLSGPNTNFLTLCVQAHKLDASNATLVLTVTGSNETSLPYGNTSYCGAVAP
jgi:hypothetical protein